MLSSPLTSVEIPNNVLNNPWLKGIFGQIYVHLPASIANNCLARAAAAACGKRLSTGIPAGFTVQILKDTGLSNRFENYSRQSTRRCFRELLECIADPAADLDTLKRIERAAGTLALHQPQKGIAFILAMNAAVKDAIEIRKSPPAVRRFGMTVPHILEEIAQRKLLRRFPRPAHGYAEDVFLELEREAACELLAEQLVAQLSEADKSNLD